MKTHFPPFSHVFLAAKQIIKNHSQGYNKTRKPRSKHWQISHAKIIKLENKPNQIRKLENSMKNMSTLSRIDDLKVGSFRAAWSRSSRRWRSRSPGGGTEARTRTGFPLDEFDRRGRLAAGWDEMWRPTEKKVFSSKAVFVGLTF